MMEVLHGVADRSRSIAVGALNFLVETGAISGREALGRIDERKDRKEPRT